MVRRALVAEDDSTDRGVVVEILRACGFVVKSVLNGEEAVAALEELKPNVFDLIVMDLSMPVMNGWEFAGFLKGSPRYSDIPMIVLTGMESRLPELMPPRSAAAVVMKPVVTSELRRVVLSMFGPARDPGGDRA